MAGGARIGGGGPVAVTTAAEVSPNAADARLTGSTGWCQVISAVTMNGVGSVATRDVVPASSRPWKCSPADFELTGASGASG